MFQTGFYGPHIKPQLEVGWVFGCQKLSVNPWAAQFTYPSPSQVPNKTCVSESDIEKEQPGNLYKVFKCCGEDVSERQAVHTDFADRHWKLQYRTGT